MGPSAGIPILPPLLPTAVCNRALAVGALGHAYKLAGVQGSHSRSFGQADTHPGVGPFGDAVVWASFILLTKHQETQ